MSEQHKPTFRPHIEPHVDFDYGDGEPPETAYREAATYFVGVLDGVLTFMKVAENKPLAVDCLAAAFGRHHITGADSQEQIGRNNGVGKADVSREIKRIQKRFGSSIKGIEPMPGQRSKQACDKFSKTRKNKCQ